jgi:hypothetical protein
MNNKYAGYAPQRGGDVYNNGGSFKGGYNGRESRVSGQDKPYVKRSGCSMRDSYTHKSGPNKGQDSGSPVIWGWKVAQGGGLIKFVAVMNKKPETKSSRWLKFVVTVTSPNAAKFLTTGFWDTQKHRLHLPDMDLIANPGKDYFGRNYTPKK